MQALASAPPLTAVETVGSPQPLDPDSVVCLAYVYQEQIEYCWHYSMVEMFGYDLSHHGRVISGGFVAIHHGTDGLVQARNMAVLTFLTEKSHANWMLWIDTDMGFPPDTADVLLEAADPVTRPIVGALCFAQRQIAPDGLGGWTCRAQPTIFDWKVIGTQSGFVARLDYERDTVTRVSGTGSACVLIHRSAFERIQLRYGQSWYSRIPNHSVGEMTSEDLSFCMKAGACDIPVHVHTGVKVTHRKSLWLGEREYDAQLSAESSSDSTTTSDLEPARVNP